jgi:signal transduction histidine kinase
MPILNFAAMDFYGKKNLWKFMLLVFAIFIGAATLFYTESFLKQLRQEEVKKVALWADAVNILQEADPETDLTLPIKIIESNTTIPVIIANRQNQIVTHANLNEQKAQDSLWLQQTLQAMVQEGNVIQLTIADGESQFLYYQNSTLLTQLRLYPAILLVVISLFIFVAYVAFSNSRKAEQNRVWNGLAKETAHQIGTPLSSLMGWLEMLKLKKANPTMLSEMEKDINRLNTITSRFSKIGSQPALQVKNLNTVTQNAVEYLKNRSPKNITISFAAPQQEAWARLNVPLYEWVIENLLRNAIDAIEKEGQIAVTLSLNENTAQIEVSDTGKGIPAHKLKAVFRPGYSTKKRGWGLGLSLAKRIIEEYHEGKIGVAQSEPQMGTTFKITLNRVSKP